MTELVTGGAGYIGSHVVRLFQSHAGNRAQQGLLQGVTTAVREAHKN